MKQGFVEDFQNLHLKLAKSNNHGYSVPKEPYHEKV